MNTGMSRMKMSGIGLLLVSIIGFFAYSYFLFATVWDILILKFTVLIGLAAILAVLGWIGYTIATAHKPEQL
jgi:preprotein translocase subunit Sss1